MTRFQGMAASDGIAIGPAWVYQPQPVTVARRAVADPAAEWERLLSALSEARLQLQGQERRASAMLGASAGAIFEAHQAFLDDEELRGALHAAVLSAGVNAEVAAHEGFERYARTLAATDDPAFQARAQDVRDVCARVLRCLHGAGDGGAPLPGPAIIIADDLTPSDTLRFERAHILGFCTVRGGPGSHAMILARSLGVPAVTGAPLELGQIAAGTLAVLDGGSGELILEPAPVELAQAGQRQSAGQSARGAQLAAAQRPAETADGHRVEVVANIGSLDDARRALAQGAEGVGLFRTEFLYLDRDMPPTEAEQTEAYRTVLRVMGGRPVVVRTLDIGGDKAAGLLGGAPELNPFLGWRGIRTIHERPALLAGQLRALLAAGGETRADLRIMLPMVTSLEEVERARAILDEAKGALIAAGGALPAQLQFGIMVEVPSAALLADVLAPHVDFFSIGTNDLTQYTLAVDRTNARVAALASPYHPAVLRLIQMTIRAAHAHGKWAGLCGELGGDVAAVPLLLGLGLDEFSMAAGAIPVVKEAIRRWSLPAAQALTAQVLALTTAGEVITFLNGQPPVMPACF